MEVEFCPSQPRRSRKSDNLNEGKKIEKCHTGTGIPRPYPRPWRVGSGSINFIPEGSGSWSGSNACLELALRLRPKPCKLFAGGTRPNYSRFRKEEDHWPKNPTHQLPHANLRLSARILHRAATMGCANRNSGPEEHKVAGLQKEVVKMTQPYNQAVKGAQILEN
ncbi:hypothetical protein M9H77_03568 [Catharanthus roseus]|uniref:Uncharacterized protein n=1 Tax=Catharanthus roseus TaxID=4058 RepID=A0ACC0CBP3_CATRO|nr:hypothetical protein M9H77_03568 [Catharanthus roseus]